MMPMMRCDIRCNWASYDHHGGELPLAFDPTMTAVEWYMEHDELWGVPCAICAGEEAEVLLVEFDVCSLGHKAGMHSVLLCDSCYNVDLGIESLIDQ